MAIPILLPRSYARVLYIDTSPAKSYLQSAFSTPNDDVDVTFSVLPFAASSTHALSSFSGIYAFHFDSR